jgi:hypothetical protein|nr:MAG TPA: hypothetical protein [Caudoviricetes sp.]
MCTYLNPNYKIKIAEEDIVCYKIVNAESSYCMSYYQNYKYTFGEVYKTDYFSPEDPWEGDTIENGAFHSYKELESALIDIEDMKDASIVRCHIPKGSKYVLGYDLDDFPCYVSEKNSYRPSL